MYKDLVERLHKRIALTTANSPLQDDLKEAVGAIEELDTHWIPVSERLPEESGVYLVTRHSYIGSKQNYTDIICYGYPEDGKRRKNRVWYFTDSEYGDIAIAFDKVIAWCDLPEPYKGGE